LVTFQRHFNATAPPFQHHCSATDIFLGITYVGSLIVTSVTGRGLPVCAFLSISESMAALTTILNHFKALNPDWPQIESFIIDKAFAEWNVIEALFPDAMVRVHASDIRKRLRTVCCYFFRYSFVSFILSRQSDKHYGITVYRRRRKIVLHVNSRSFFTAVRKLHSSASCHNSGSA
jgi:hypothetical protein